MLMQDFVTINQMISGTQFLGQNHRFAEHFATTFSNTTDGLKREVGCHLPNSLGLFDFYGNAYELCIDSVESDGKPEWKVVGGDSGKLHPSLIRRRVTKRAPGRQR